MRAHQVLLLFCQNLGGLVAAAHDGLEERSSAVGVLFLKIKLSSLFGRQIHKTRLTVPLCLYPRPSRRASPRPSPCWPRPPGTGRWSRRDRSFKKQNKKKKLCVDSHPMREIEFSHLSSTETSFSFKSRSMTAHAPASAAAWRGWNPVDLCRLTAMVDHSGGPE